MQWWKQASNHQKTTAGPLLLQQIQIFFSNGCSSFKKQGSSSLIFLSPPLDHCLGLPHRFFSLQGNIEEINRTIQILSLIIILSLNIIYFCSLASKQVDNLALQTKTVAGHNLPPTPWHLFPPKNFDDQSRHARAYQILHCSYLTCPYSNTSVSKGHGFNSPSSSPKCPRFFMFIHHDLEPWAQSRITVDHIMGAKNYASFRVVIYKGRLYLDPYYACVQSRMMFTIWGFLQLLKRYPGMVPDVDIMFDCMDKPSINKTEHDSFPLPLFRYCTTKDHFDIPFPDWSFWGW